MVIYPVRKIIHLDMDAFFASVEIKDKPSLANLPLVVGGDPNSRGVVAAASYKAREFGIHSAMPCSRAYKLCPQAVFVPPRFHRYQEVSSQIHSIFQKYTDIIEPVSLDEAWLDVSQNLINSPSATWLAERIKQDIYAATGLTGSAGVSYNKFLAKIASDEKKPNGLFVITPQTAQNFLKQISVKKIPGVGKVTYDKLHQLGIDKGYHLLEQPEAHLVKHFGKFGGYLYQIIRGIDNRPVITHRELKSIGIETTFTEDYQYGEPLLRELEKLLTGLFKRLKKKNKQGKTFGLKVKFFDFHQVTRSVTINNSVLSEDVITRLAYQKLSEVAEKEFPNKKIRLLGLAISNFEEVDIAPTGNQQLDIFHFLNQSDSLTVQS
jgi:DNA polymerase-4